MIPGMGKAYSQEVAMDLLGITRPTYYKYVAEDKVRRFKFFDPLDPKKWRWAVYDEEIKRVKAIIDAGWVRGKSKFPKKDAKKAGRK